MRSSSRLPPEGSKPGHTVDLGRKPTFYAGTRPGSDISDCLNRWSAKKIGGRRETARAHPIMWAFSTDHERVVAKFWLRDSSRRVLTYDRCEAGRSFTGQGGRLQVTRLSVAAEHRLGRGSGHHHRRRAGVYHVPDHRAHLYHEDQWLDHHI